MSLAPREPTPRLCAPSSALRRTRSHSDSGSVGFEARGRRRRRSASGCDLPSGEFRPVAGPETATRAPRSRPAPGAARAWATRPGSAGSAGSAGSCSCRRRRRGAADPGPPSRAAAGDTLRTERRALGNYWPVQQRVGPTRPVCRQPTGRARLTAAVIPSWMGASPPKFEFEAGRETYDAGRV